MDAFQIFSKSITHSQDAAHVISGFLVGGNAAKARNRVGPRVIGGERKFGRAKARQHHQKITGRAIKVGLPVMRIHILLRRRRGHQLAAGGELL